MNSIINLKSNDISLQKAIFDRQFWLIAMIFFVIGFCTSAIVVHIAPYATDQGIPSPMQQVFYL